MSTISFYEYHNVYGFWGKKNFERNIYFEQINKEIKIQHNSNGTRDDEYDFNNSNEKILCLGGSHTWGAAVELKNRYSNLLTANFASKDFLNFGQCSFGLDQIFFLLKNEINKLKPTHVIIEQYPWALLRTINNFVNGYIRPHFYLKNNKIFEKKLPYLNRFVFFRKTYGNYISFKKEFNEYLENINLDISKNNIDPLFKIWNQSFYNEMYLLSKHIFLNIKEICKKHNTKLIIIVNMCKEEFFDNLNIKSDLIDYRLPRLKTINILQGLDIPYIDLQPLYSKSSNTPFFLDGHINKYGNYIIAEELSKII